MTNNEEFDLDCQELERLLTLTTRDSVKNILSQQIQTLKEPVKDQEELRGPDEKGDTRATSGADEKGDTQATPGADEKGDTQVTPGAVSSSDEPPGPVLKGAAPDIVPKPSESQKILVSKLPTKTITSYGWDQSPKFVKLYVTLNGVQSLAKEDITVEYTSSSMSLKVRKSDVLHQLIINSLLQQIIPDKSHHKVKTDNLVILMKKREEKNWDYLTQTEKKAKQKGKPAAPKTNTGDPSAGIMDLMQTMYDDGDDDMKRSIAQAWTQAREKKDTMELP